MIRWLTPGVCGLGGLCQVMVDSRGLFVGWVDCVRCSDGRLQGSVCGLGGLCSGDQMVNSRDLFVGWADCVR